MQKIQASSLNATLSIDAEKYSVLIKKTDLNDKNRLYYICFKKDLSDSNSVIFTYFSKPNSKMIEIWEQDAIYFEESQETTLKISEEVDLILSSEEPKKKSFKIMVPATWKIKEDMIEII